MTKKKKKKDIFFFFQLVFNKIKGLKTTSEHILKTYILIQNIPWKISFLVILWNSSL